MKYILALLFSVFGFVSAHADVGTCAPRNGPPEEIELPLGYECQTVKGALFKRISHPSFQQAWQGPDLIWSEDISPLLPTGQTDAARECEKLTGRLPTKEEYGRAEGQGIRDVLPNMIASRLWTSSADPQQHDHYFYFDGKSGSADNTNPGFLHYGVVCITDARSPN